MPTLTQAQLTLLKTDLLANTNTVTYNQASVQIKDLPFVNGDACDVAATWYNGTAAGPFVVWRDLKMETILSLITYASMTPVDAVPTVTALGSNPSVAAQATYDNQVATVAIWRARSLSCQGKQFNLQNLTIGRTTAPMKQTNYRGALQDCLTAIPAGASGATIAANWVGVRDAAKFSATNAEKVFATGTGTTASPADVPSGMGDLVAFQLSGQNVQDAINLG